MCSTASATLGTWFKIKGLELFDLLGLRHFEPLHRFNAYEHDPMLGKQDMMFAGGCEELDWTLSVLFDAMGAMSSAI